MTELAQTYLGNCIGDSGLANRVAIARTAATCLEVYLSQSDSLKGRIYAQSTSGEMIGIVKERCWLLTEGDVFETEQGQLLIIHLEVQKVMVLSFTDEAKGHEIDLVHLGHTIGNHHWPILIREDKIYVQISAALEVMETTILSFGIPGLSLEYELRSPNQQLTFSKHSHH